MWTSVPQIPVRSTRMRTSLIPTSGSGTSSSQRPGSARLLTRAFTRAPQSVAECRSGSPGGESYAGRAFTEPKPSPPSPRGVPASPDESPEWPSASRARAADAVIPSVRTVERLLDLLLREPVAKQTLDHHEVMPALPLASRIPGYEAHERAGELVLHGEDGRLGRSQCHDRSLPLRFEQRKRPQARPPEVTDDLRGGRHFGRLST